MIEWGSFIGSVIGGAIIGQIAFVYGKRVGRRLERKEIAAYVSFLSGCCGRSIEEIVAAIKRRGR